MTIASEVNRSGPYIGNDVTTVFSGTFKIADEAHVQVIQAVTATGVETVKTLTTHYSVAGVGDASFSVTMVTAPATGETITLIRDVPFVQELDLQNQGAYYAETVEEAFDLSVARDQQLLEELSRAVRVSASSGVDPDDLIATLVATAAAVAATYDSFDDRYLGAKAVAPTLDNDGAALITGALYWDTVAAAMKVWSGAAWLVAYAPTGAYAATANNLSDLSNAATAFGNIKQAASAIASGVVELATDAEIITGTDTARAVTPSNVTALFANGQIKFPATQNASADANTLDDYEEGTFTPTMTCGASSAGVTYTTQIGVYTKIGNVVHVLANVLLSNNGSGSGAMVLASMPFTAASTVPLTVRYQTLAAAIDGVPNAYIGAGTITVILQYLPNTGTAVSTLTDTNVANTFNCLVGGIYFI